MLFGDITEEEMKSLTPESGFNLVGIDFFESVGSRLYLIEHFERYQDALSAKKGRKNSDNYLILYKGPGNEFLFR
jgi:hypothetical protein